MRKGDIRKKLESLTSTRVLNIFNGFWNREDRIEWLMNDESSQEELSQLLDERDPGHDCIGRR